MDCQWLKLSPSLSKGINVINRLDDKKFEQFLNHVVTHIKFQEKYIFTEQEKLKLEKIFNIDEDILILVIKTVIYIFKKALRFIFMPGNLKTDLNIIGFSDFKAESVIKFWSNDTRSALNNCCLNNVAESCKKEFNVKWKLNVELSSEYQKKTKSPKAYLTLSDTELELTHSELHNMYVQLDLLQNEIDNILQ